MINTYCVCGNTVGAQKPKVEDNIYIYIFTYAYHSTAQYMWICIGAMIGPRHRIPRPSERWPILYNRGGSYELHWPKGHGSHIRNVAWPKNLMSILNISQYGPAIHDIDCSSYGHVETSDEHRELLGKGSSVILFLGSILQSVSIRRGHIQLEPLSIKLAVSKKKGSNMRASGKAGCGSCQTSGS